MVDDDIRVVELLQITLSGRGYTVYTAYDGESVLEEVERRNPDLLVLDLTLPRRNGFQILEELRASERTASLPVILISSDASNEARIHGLRLGADDFLLKPFSPRELIVKIRRILDRVADQRLLSKKAERLEDELRKQRQAILTAHHEMDRNLLRIGAVLQHIEDLNQTRSPDSVLEECAHALVGDLGLSQVCVFALDQNNRQYVPRAWRGLDERAAINLSISADGFLAQVLSLEGRTMMLDEFAEYPRAREEVLRLSAAGIVHLTPVRAKEGLVALIGGSTKASGQPLDRFDVHLLGVISRSAAVSLENASAFEGVRDSFVETTAHLIAALESRYESLAGHSERVRDLALRICSEMGISPRVRDNVEVVARLHDLGALSEYEHVFGEQRFFTDEERADLRKRSSLAVRRLLEASHLSEVADAVYSLSEYWDGTGLPEGLAGEAIPIEARIVALANAYDALTHPRPHRPAYTHDEAMTILRQRSGHQFDPEVFAAFAKLFEAEGATVDPSDGVEATSSTKVPGRPAVGSDDSGEGADAVNTVGSENAHDLKTIASSGEEGGGSEGKDGPASGQD